jgi:hypothetical protein
MATKTERSKVLLTLSDWDLHLNGVKGRVTNKQFEEIAESLMEILNEEGHWLQAIKEAIAEVLG